MIPIQIVLMGSKVQQQVSISDQSANMKDINGPAAVYELDAAGTGFYTKLAGGSNTFTWLLLGLNSDYQVRATLTSGPIPNGSPMSSWLSLSSNRNWSLNSAGTSVILVEIRRVSDSVTIASANITINFVETVGGGGGS